MLPSMISVLSNPQVSVRAKIVLLEASVFQRLFYGSATWADLSISASKKLRTFYHKAVRTAVSMLNNETRHHTHEDALAAADIIPCEWQIRRRRLAHLPHLWNAGPPVLFHQHTSKSWLSVAQGDVEQLRQYAPRVRKPLALHVVKKHQVHSDVWQFCYDTHCAVCLQEHHSTHRLHMHVKRHPPVSLFASGSLFLLKQVLLPLFHKVAASRDTSESPTFT